MSFQGKRVWITGASSGIGAALAAAFANEGARLVLSGRRRAALAEVAARVQPDAAILPFEATGWAALAGVVEEAGAVDVLVNNARSASAALPSTRGPRSIARSSRPTCWRRSG
jgi:NAD(P)-dependent dehydrogenase (short-subunit alcohol dehydrogenase family)